MENSQRTILAITIATPMKIVAIDFVSDVPPGRFISLAKPGLMKEAKPIIETIMPTIRTVMFAILLPLR